MTAYIKQSNWVLKDANKDQILGADLDAEFTAIKASTDTKLEWFNSAGPTLHASGNVLTQTGSQGVLQLTVGMSLDDLNAKVSFAAPPSLTANGNLLYADSTDPSETMRASTFTLVDIANLHTLVPIGAVITWSGALADLDGRYLRIFGQTLDKAANPEFLTLFQAVGVHWQGTYGGSGDQFTAPNWTPPTGAIYAVRYL